MIALRMLAMFAGALVLLLPPIALASPGTGDLPGFEVTALLLGLAVTAASFVYVGMAGERMRRRGRERWLGAALLAVPIVGGLGVLARSVDPVLLSSGGVVLAFSLVLFLVYVFPTLAPSARPLRKREREHLRQRLAMPAPRG